MPRFEEKEISRNIEIDPIKVVTAVNKESRMLHATKNIKQWCHLYYLRRKNDGGVIKKDDLVEALNLVNQDLRCKNYKIIFIAMGYSIEEVSEAIDSFENIKESSRVEIVVSSIPEFHGEDGGRNSASILRASAVTSTTDLFSMLRKAFIKQRVKGWVKIRPLQGKKELKDYFSLRYDVWNNLGYIPKEKNADILKMELDFSDRFSYPLGAFDQNQNIIGCARLVFPMHQVQLYYEKYVDEIVREANDPVLSQNFQVLEKFQHPFDILESFNGFDDYYSSMVKRKINKAEVSRVIVHPDFRGRWLGEVLVDSLIDTAYCSFQIKELFLACESKNEGFYSKCGFEILEGLSCERFANVNVPAIAMGLKLF
ncbi:MAG: GNAT family N-acetyltransferase [Candidatus Nitronauta litoralis]|uniref:GNAT family N-acetyltransferase n=1 Tax=Candidatus Nitronauta litoralis TaxID=2705533 RepID=A0A7T0G136_9BACT|nr:MAG: GNAT family N-acetyltransferase [Candidatus Nitronauta litoralis]